MDATGFAVLILGLAATVAGMALPPAYPKAPIFIWRALFWFGIGGMIWAVIYLALTRLQIDEPMPTALGLTAFAGLLGVIGWNFPRAGNGRPEAAPPIERHEDEKPWKNTLEVLFDSLLSQINTEKLYTVRVKKEEIGLDEEVHFRFHLHQDFVSCADFVSVFMPRLAFRLDDKTDELLTEELLIGLRDQIKTLREAVKAWIGIRVEDPGTGHPTAMDLTFSGRVYIYTLNPLTPIQIGDLGRLYREQGMFLEIRGHDYWMFHRNDLDVLQPNPAKLQGC